MQRKWSQGKTQHGHKDAQGQAKHGFNARPRGVETRKTWSQLQGMRNTIQTVDQGIATFT